eukprot:COSAG06_NODE_19070_length_853_cov_67.357616_1_plen_69_part_10
METTKHNDRIVIILFHRALRARRPRGPSAAPLRARAAGAARRSSARADRSRPDPPAIKQTHTQQNTHTH